MSELAMIVAAAENGVIGRNNALPWDLPEDLRYFRRVTMGKPIIMGRKTFEAIGRPLPGRCNIVVSRQADFSAQGVRVAGSLEEAVGIGSAVADIDGVDEVMLIGGAKLYAQGLPLVKRIYLTRIHAEVEGDASLPEVDWSDFVQVGAERHAADDESPFDYSFLVYQRAQKT